MADKKITQLPAAGAITGAELIEMVQGGVNVQAIVSNLNTGFVPYLGASADLDLGTFIIRANGAVFSSKVFIVDGTQGNTKVLTSNGGGQGTWLLPLGNMSEVDIDITGSSNLNLNTVTEGIINLKSTNPTETLNTVSNYSGQGKFILRPQSGLTLTVNDASVAAGNMRLDASTKVIVGSKQGFIELQQRSLSAAIKFYQTSFIDQYV